MESGLHRTLFLRHLEQLYQALGAKPFIAPADATHAPSLGIHFQYRGCNFVWVHALEPELSLQMLIECQLGALPAAHRESACRHLLVLNYELSLEFASGFSLDETERIVLTRSCALDSVEPDQLVTLVQGLAGLASSWQAANLIGPVTAGESAPLPDASVMRA